MESNDVESQESNDVAMTFWEHLEELRRANYHHCNHNRRFYANMSVL